jgi:formylmethanofuran dehydrogenase subunit C
MSALTLTLSQVPTHPLDCSPLLPASLAGMSARALKGLLLSGGPEPVKLGDFFEIDGKCDGSLLVIVNRRARLDNLGAGLTAGELHVRGGAGRFAGRGMRGGLLRIRGGAMDYLATGMRGGVVDVAGDVGDFCAGALPNEPFGLNGGLVLVDGDAGDRLADRQRRGVVFVTGSAGSLAGSRMFAGSVIVLGDSGPGAGIGLRRGTLLLAGRTSDLPATFVSSGVVELPFVGLMARRLAEAHKLCRPLLALGTRFERLCGDLGNGGAGELLRPATSSGRRGPARPRA